MRGVVDILFRPRRRGSDMRIESVATTSSARIPEGRASLVIAARASILPTMTAVR